MVTLENEDINASYWDCVLATQTKFSNTGPAIESNIARCIIALFPIIMTVLPNHVSISVVSA